MNFLAVFLGGGIGSVVRFSIGVYFQKSNLSLPIATLVSNVIACIIFAVSLYFLESKAVASSALKLFVLTGFCGGLSTFSTFGYESFLLFKQGNITWLTINIFMSLTLCIGSFILIKK